MKRDKYQWTRRAMWVVQSATLLILMLGLSSGVRAVTKENADAEYTKGDYQQAVKDYEEVLRSGANADIYYNLGNAYFRLDNITKAILNYERAMLMQPGNADIRFNLEFARSKTIDKITPESEMFFVTWYKTLVNYTSVDGWACCAILSIMIALLLALVYLFSPRVWMRKLSFFMGLALFFLFIFSNLFAYQQYKELTCRTGAIVIVSSAVVKKTPTDNGTDQFVIHEGTKVNITDEGMKDWRGIRLADGREGWIPASQIEKI